MSFKVIWSPKSKKKLSKLDKETITSIIKKAEESKTNPKRYLERLKKINAFKLRTGEYRLIINLDQNKNEMNILTLGHRRNIYKEINKKLKKN